MHEVKRVTRQPGAARVRRDDLNAVEATSGNEFSRHLNVSGVAVEPDDAPAGGNPPVEQLEDPAWPAAEIDSAGALAKPPLIGPPASTSAARATAA